MSAATPQPHLAPSPSTTEPPPVVAGYARHPIMVPCSVTRSGRFVRIRNARNPGTRGVVLSAAETFVEVRNGGRYLRLWAVDELDGLHLVELPNGRVLWVNTAEGLIERRKRAEKRKPTKNTANRPRARVGSLPAVA